MSPEQLSGDPLDSRSDIYALGLVAFNMFTGKLPFPGETMQESMIMRLTDEPHTLTAMKPDVPWPEDLQAVMNKALARSTADRYATASAFAHDLVQAIDRMPVTSITAMGTEMMRRMSAGSVHAAQTAATVQVNVPKTRVATKDDAPVKRPSAAAAPPPATPTKSKTALYGGIGATVVAAGLIGAFVLTPGSSKTGPDSANSPVTSSVAPQAAETTKGVPPTTTPSTVGEPNRPTDSGPSVDTQLDQLNQRATDDTTQAGNLILLNRVQALRSQLRTRDQRVFAAMIEALAQGVLDTTNTKSCDALRRVATEAPSTKHAAEHATALSTCRDPN